MSSNINFVNRVYSTEEVEDEQTSHADTKAELAAVNAEIDDI